jgi:hypothetical protein
MRRVDVCRKGSHLARCALPRHANGYDARSSEAAFPTTVKDRRRARRIVVLVAPPGYARMGGAAVAAPAGWNVDVGWIARNASRGLRPIGETPSRPTGGILDHET